MYFNTNLVSTLLRRLYENKTTNRVKKYRRRFISPIFQLLSLGMVGDEGERIRTPLAVA